jgi:MarR family transcriptional regulator, organic hydroperoxide resistance regulator
MKREETIDHQIKALWHAIYRMYNQQALKVDLTTSIGFVLLIIDPKEGTPATKIAPLMGLEARSLTRMLKSMEEKGYIRKQQDETDKRSVRISLTELGMVKKELARETVLAFNHRVREEIPLKELEIFMDVAQRVTRLIESKSIFQ